MIYEPSSLVKYLKANREFDVFYSLESLNIFHEGFIRSYFLLGLEYDDFLIMSKCMDDFSKYIALKYKITLSISFYSILNLQTSNNLEAVDLFLAEYDTFWNKFGEKYQPVTISVPKVSDPLVWYDEFILLDRMGVRFLGEQSLTAINCYISGIEFGFKMFMPEGHFEPNFEDFSKWLAVKCRRNCNREINYSRLIKYQLACNEADGYRQFLSLLKEYQNRKTNQTQ